jgi:hypothetical protein
MLLENTPAAQTLRSRDAHRDEKRVITMGDKFRSLHAREPPLRAGGTQQLTTMAATQISRSGAAGKV